MTAGVYFIECEGYVKVGKSRNVEARLATMQTGCPFEMKLIHVRMPSRVAAGVIYREERRLHRRYAPTRERGERFRLDGLLRDDLAEWGKASVFVVPGRETSDVCLASRVARRHVERYVIAQTVAKIPRQD